MAGRGGWKKRRPSCNEADRSWDITPRESGLTSVWSLITGELGEPPSRGNANDGQARTGWCALSRDECGVAASAYREGVTRFTRRTASPREGRLRGLSRVKGNFHARFLGGGAAATPPCYPAGDSRLPPRHSRTVGWVNTSLFRGLDKSDLIEGAPAQTMTGFWSAKATVKRIRSGSSQNIDNTTGKTIPRRGPRAVWLSTQLGNAVRLHATPRACLEGTAPFQFTAIPAWPSFSAVPWRSA